VGEEAQKMMSGCVDGSDVVSGQKIAKCFGFPVAGHVGVMGLIKS
jgi:hypothetical protein